MLLLQLLTVLGCGIVAIQDLRDREVLWILFPSIALFLASLHISHVGLEHFAFFALNNIILVSCILLLLWTVTKYIFKKRFLDVSFGTGDMLFMYAFTLGFPTLTFIVLLVGSILFSLMAFLILKLFVRAETVPLAGLMGIFLIAVLLATTLPNSLSLYII